MTPPDPSSEDPLASLRTEIRRAGQFIRDCAIPWWTCTSPFLLLVVLGLILGAVTGSLTLLGTAAILCFGLAIWAAPFGLRWLLRRHFRAALDSLAPDERRAVLAPFGVQPGLDTWGFARPLLRAFSVPTELAPSEPPEGTGAEVTGVQG